MERTVYESDGGHVFAVVICTLMRVLGLWCNSTFPVFCGQRAFPGILRRQRAGIAGGPGAGSLLGINLSAGSVFSFCLHLDGNKRYCRKSWSVSECLLRRCSTGEIGWKHPKVVILFWRDALSVSRFPRRLQWNYCFLFPAARALNFSVRYTAAVQGERPVRHLEAVDD